MIKALVGGDLAKYEMDARITDIRLRRMNAFYNQTTCQANAWDTLYNNSSRMVKSAMDDIVDKWRNEGYNNRQAKAAAWEEWYSLSNERAQFDMDIILVKEKLRYSSVSRTAAQTEAWDIAYAYSYKNELDVMLDRVIRNNPEATEDAIKEVAWNIHLRETGNLFQKDIMNEILAQVTAEMPDAPNLKAIAWQRFYDASDAKRVEYDRIMHYVREANPSDTDSQLKRKAWQKLYDDYTVDNELLEAQVAVQPRVATNLAQALVFDPSQKIELSNIQQINFNGIVDTAIVEWKDIDETKLVNNFKGKIFYSDMELIDKLFGNQIIRNVRITIQQLDIIGIRITGDSNVMINPYDKETINQFLAQFDDYIPEFQRNKFGLELAGGVVLWDNPNRPERYWEFLTDSQGIPVWRYANGSGFDYDGNGNNSVILTVRNFGYDQNPVWMQEIIFTINPDYILDRTVIDFADQFATSQGIKKLADKTPEDEQLGIIWMLKDGQLNIMDAFKMSKIEQLYVKFKDNSVSLLPATLNFGSYAEEFYAHSEFYLNKGIKIGTMLNTIQEFNINVVNTSPRLVYTYIDEITGEVKKIFDSTLSRMGTEH